jgi:surface antigen
MSAGRAMTLLLAASIVSGCVANAAPSFAPVVPPPSSSGTPVIDANQLLAPLDGGLVGTLTDKQLTPGEKQRGLVAEYQALENGFGRTPVTWVDERTGNGGTVTAGTPYRVGQQDCRPYAHAITIKNQPTNLNGAACRQSDGSWLRLD